MNPRDRARRILAWREEQRVLEQEGATAPSDTTLAAVQKHHDALLAGFAAAGDVDLSREEERLSAGMRLVTLVGAAALSIAWAMLVASVWEDLGRTSQLTLVWLPPLLLLPATAWVARREPSGYVANIVGSVGAIAVAVAGFATYDVYGRDNPRLPFLLFGAYGLVLAYRFRLVLPLLIGIVGAGAWVWSLESVVTGAAPSNTFDHAEPLILVGLAALLVGMQRRQDPPAFGMMWRLAGVTAMVAPLLVLGMDASSSWFGRSETTELVYQLVGLVTFVTMVWLGLRRDDVILARGGATALVLFLFFRMVDWFWDAIPDWLFFLLVGGLAFAALLVLRRVRERRRASSLYLPSGGSEDGRTS